MSLTSYPFPSIFSPLVIVLGLGLGLSQLSSELSINTHVYEDIFNIQQLTDVIFFPHSSFSSSFEVFLILFLSSIHTISSFISMSLLLCRSSLHALSSSISISLLLLLASLHASSSDCLTLLGLRTFSSSFLFSSSFFFSIHLLLAPLPPFHSSPFPSNIVIIILNS